MKSRFVLNRMLRKRNVGLHSVATALTDTVSAPGTHDEPLVVVDAGSPAQAPGHRHRVPPAERTTSRLSHRAWRRGRLGRITPVICRGPDSSTPCTQAATVRRNSVASRVVSPFGELWPFDDLGAALATQHRFGIGE